MMRVLFSSLLVLLPFVLASAQVNQPPGPSYVLSFPKPHTHLFEVAMSVENVTSAQLDLQMATWTPGSYLQREFERNVPYDHYTFIVGVQPGIGGGTEHVNANVSLTTPAAFKTDKDYKSFLGLESHEYFHNWNVKRIRPLALGPFDYQSENYTHNLWVSEGFTDYYGKLILRRAGLTTAKDYLETLGKLLAGF